MTTIGVTFSSAKSAISFFHLAHLAEPRALHLSIQGIVTAQEANSLATQISKSSETLTDLYLTCNELAYSDVLSISHCHLLKSLKAPIRCSPNDIDHLAHGLPNLEILRLLDRTCDHKTYDYKLDLTCLSSLARHCKKLKRLTLPLDPSHVIPQSWESSRFSHLEYIRIICRRFSESTGLALFLSTISVKSLEVLGLRSERVTCDGWEEVRKLVPILQAARREEREMVARSFNVTGQGSS